METPADKDQLWAKYQRLNKEQQESVSEFINFLVEHEKEELSLQAQAFLEERYEYAKKHPDKHVTHQEFRKRINEKYGYKI